MFASRYIELGDDMKNCYLTSEFYTINIRSIKIVGNFGKHFNSTEELLQNYDLNEPPIQQMITTRYVGCAAAYYVQQNVTTDDGFILNRPNELQPIHHWVCMHDLEQRYVEEETLYDRSGNDVVQYKHKTSVKVE